MLYDHILDDRPPPPGQVCSIGPVEDLRRDALLFDRVFFPTAPLPGFEGIEVPPLELTFGTRADTQLYFDKAAPFCLSILGGSGLAWCRGFNHARRALTAKYDTEGIAIVPIYHQFLDFSDTYKDGETIAYEAALTQIPMVSNEDISWDQVFQFRSDPESVAKYRNLRMWLQHSLKADSKQHAVDLIAQKLDDYRWSIEKHGLKTKSGSLSQILDVEKAFIPVASGIATGAIAGPIWGTLVGGLVALGKVGIWLSERRVDLADVRRSDKNREVAIIYDSQKQFRDPGRAE